MTDTTACVTAGRHVPTTGHLPTACVDARVESGLQAASAHRTTLVTTADLAVYDVVDYQVWVSTPEGGRYLYRDNLGYSVATTWNVTKPESDVPAGSTFFAVRATTSFAAIS